MRWTEMGKVAAVGVLLGALHFGNPLTAQSTAAIGASARVITPVGLVTEQVLKPVVAGLLGLSATSSWASVVAAFPIRSTAGRLYALQGTRSCEADRCRVIVTVQFLAN